MYAEGQGLRRALAPGPSGAPHPRDNNIKVEKKLGGGTKIQGATPGPTGLSPFPPRAGARATTGPLFLFQGPLWSQSIYRKNSRHPARKYLLPDVQRVPHWIPFFCVHNIWFRYFFFEEGGSRGLWSKPILKKRFACGGGFAFSRNFFFSGRWLWLSIFHLSALQRSGVLKKFRVQGKSRKQWRI